MSRCYMRPVKPLGDFKAIWAASPPTEKSLWKEWLSEVTLGLHKALQEAGVEAGDPALWALAVQCWLIDGWAQLSIEQNSLRPHLMLWDGFAQKYQPMPRIKPEAFAALVEEYAKSNEETTGTPPGPGASGADLLLGWHPPAE